MSSLPRAAFYLLFTASGFAGLIYESIWSHYLKLYLGHAAYAQSLVLVVFMGGMALGAAGCGGFSARPGAPARPARRLRARGSRDRARGAGVPRGLRRAHRLVLCGAVAGAG